MQCFIFCMHCCVICTKYSIANVETFLVRQEDTKRSLICQKKCLPGFAWEVEAMAYSEGKYQCLRQRKRASQAKRRTEEQKISLNLQRYILCVGRVTWLGQTSYSSSKLKVQFCFEKSLQIRNIRSLKTQNKASRSASVVCIDHSWSV